MSLAAMIRRMGEAGAPPEAIAIAMEEIEALQSALEARRSADRERKRDWRERQKSADVTGQSADSHGTVTPDPSPQSPPLKVSPDPFKESPLLTPQPEGRAARENGTRLPEGWKPTKLGEGTVSSQILAARGRDWALRALESFRNHWRSANGPNARKRDWQAAWANWVIEQDNRDGRTANRGGGGRMGGPPADPTLAVVRAAIAGQRRDGGDHREARAALPAGQFGGS